ncbi:MAG: HAD-IIIC family phosphatase [Desulfovibrio sp.]|nr:HAD-IIIC family phosphatase [Desulfovibrio sp.]
MGLRYLPALFRPAIKALALDCDNTLYAGVLAEDGPDGVRPYLEVQHCLRELARQGFLLTLVSRNEEADVHALFARREDFPLRWEDFAATVINWEAKSENIRRVAEKLNIGVDAVAFIDDNWGELSQVGLALPEVRLLAASSPQATLRALHFCPLLWKPGVLLEDSLRRADVQANATRVRLQSAYSPQEYRQKLGICLTFSVNPRQRAERVTELLNKTNQFIFTFLRPTAQDVQDYMHRGDRVCVVCHMRDTLSDSGLIAIVLGSRTNHGSGEEELRVDELAVSCRALGRGVETGMIFALLARACAALDCQRLRLVWKTGPRNAPGLTWLQEHWPGEVGDGLATADARLLRGHLEGVIVADASPGEAGA